VPCYQKHAPADCFFGDFARWDSRHSQVSLTWLWYIDTYLHCCHGYRYQHVLSE